MSWNIENSTRLGSIRMYFSSSGVAWKSMPAISALMQTLFPDPVAPAIRRCGMRVMSPTTVLPETSVPIASDNSVLSFWKVGVWMISRRVTRLVALLGTSIPSAGLPGMGAWMRIAAESASARSFCSAVILRTGTPWPGCSSYCVTDGPELTPITVASTSKLASVPSISLIFALISSCNRSLRTVTVSSKVRSGFIQTRWISSSTRVALVSSPPGTTANTGWAVTAFVRCGAGAGSSSIGSWSAASADCRSGDGGTAAGLVGAATPGHRLDPGHQQLGGRDQRREDDEDHAPPEEAHQSPAQQVHGGATGLECDRQDEQPGQQQKADSGELALLGLRYLELWKARCLDSKALPRRGALRARDALSPGSHTCRVAATSAVTNGCILACGDRQEKGRLVRNPEQATQQ